MNPTRLDRWLRRLYPALTQGVIEKLLREKKILVEGSKAFASTRIMEENQVTFKTDLKIYEQPLPVKNLTHTYTSKDRAYLQSMILWEDNDICVLNKPTGLAVQGGTHTPYHLDGLLQAHGSYKLVHRLDRDTSGVLVVAKTLEMAQYLHHSFKNRQVQKVYWAVVEGVPNPTYGSITDSIPDKDKERMAEAKEALTSYRLLKKLDSQTSWVELKPHTGRTHQLRLHMASIGCAIWGDGKYGSLHPKDLLQLHAWRLSIPIPTQSYPLTFTAPPSESMVSLLKEFGCTTE